MAGYIGSKSSVTLVDGYTEAEADAEFVAKSTTGNLTLDVSGNITLDADGGNVRFKDGGTEYGTINKNGTANLSIYSSASDADMLFQGNDGGSVITAMTIDMSAGGNVGIGTTTPENTLHILDTSATSQMLVQGNTNDASIKFNKSGQSFVVGIDATDDSFRIADNSTLGTNDRLVIDSSGNLLVGTTDAQPPTNNDASGIALRADGKIAASRSNGISGDFNVGANGDIVWFRKSGTVVGIIGVSSGAYLTIGTGDTGILFDPSGNRFYPCDASTQANRDNAIDVGASSVRFDDIYATNGTIQTSDATEKQDIASLTATEMLVGKRISALFKTFRWKDSVAEKGDNARTHTGVIAQDVQAAFTAEGLDAGDYALFISSTWWEHDVDVPAVEAVEAVDFVTETTTDEDGNEVVTVITEAVEAVEAKDAYTRTDTYDTEDEAPEGATERTRMGIRYPELLSFVAAYNEQRFASIEARLTALEA